MILRHECHVVLGVCPRDPGPFDQSYTSRPARRLPETVASLFSVCLKDETIVKLVYTQTPDTSTTRYKLFLHTEDVWKMSRKFPVNLSVTCRFACRFGCSHLHRLPFVLGGTSTPASHVFPPLGSGRSSTGLEGCLSRLEREGPGAIRLSARDGKQVSPVVHGMSIGCLDKHG